MWKDVRILGRDAMGSAEVVAIDLRSSASDEAGLPALLGLAGLLNRMTGVSFVYEALDAVVGLFGLDDAALVLTDTAIGRQVFRHRRRARRGGGDAAELWSDAFTVAPAGLYALPDRPLGPEVSDYVVDLATAALRLDVLRQHAGRDPLTGLLNRRSYEEALAAAIARSRRYGWPFALVLIDLDNFKAVNDEFGHATGDAALRLIGAETRAVLRRGDIAARLGGDEFALIVLNADSPGALAPLVERLTVALAQVMPAAAIRFSAGVACFPQDAEDGEHLAALADQRMYASKPMA